MNWKTIFNPFEKFDEKYVLLWVLYFSSLIFLPATLREW